MSSKSFTERATIQSHIGSSNTDEIGYDELKEWIEVSLDSFRNELLELLYPLFVHIYLDLVQQNKPGGAAAFFKANKLDFRNKERELIILNSISLPIHVKESQFAQSFRQNKYGLRLGKYAFDIFIRFLEENNYIHILKLVNQYIQIKVAVRSKEDVPNGIEETMLEPKGLNLGTKIVSPLCENVILNDEQYKHGHLEKSILELRKQKAPDTLHNINASFIKTEINKIQDIIKRVNINENNLPSICCYTIHNSFDQICCVEISNDLTRLACGLATSIIIIYSLDKNELRCVKTSTELAKVDLKEFEESIYESVGFSKKLIGHSGSVFAIKFFNSGKFLLSGSSDTTVRMWSLDLFKCLAVYKAHSHPIWCVDITNSDVYFACGCADKTVTVWNINEQKPERLFTSSFSDVSSVKFHPNSNYIFYGSYDHKIRMFDIESAKMMRLFNGHSDAVTCLDVSHDGSFLVSSGRDKTIIVWHIEQSKILSRFKGHSSLVNSVSFCYFGTVIVSAGSDNSVRLWNIKAVKNQCLGVYFTKKTPVLAAKFGYRNIISCVGPFQS